MRTVLPPSLNSTAICLGRVSLVMMASDGVRRRFADESSSNVTALLMPARTLAIGIVTPMRPVEPTKTCSVRQCAECFASKRGHFARVFQTLVCRCRRWRCRN